jgi:hypothetical protein
VWTADATASFLNADGGRRFKKQNGVSDRDKAPPPHAVDWAKVVIQALALFFGT